MWELAWEGLVRWRSLSEYLLGTAPALGIPLPNEFQSLLDVSDVLLSEVAAHQYSLAAMPY